MATICEPPSDYPAEIIGYAEPWIVSPGDTVAIKISSTEPEYKYRTVRIIQSVDIEHSPRKQEEVISVIPAGEGKGRYQLARPGSYALVEDWVPGSVSNVKGLEISFYMQPWLPKSGHTQTLVSALDVDLKTGFAAVITEAGKLDFWIGTGKDVEVITTDFGPAKKRWVEVKVVLEGIAFAGSITPVSLFAEPPLPPIKVERQLTNPFAMPASTSLLFGASYAESTTAPFPRPTNFFNGRLDSPSIKTTNTPTTTLVKYDFSRNMSSDLITDVSGNGHTGKLINAPTRAVRGWDWDGTESDWTKAKYGYGAIHFHEDDLDDAQWETDFSITIPEDARSGAYAVEVDATSGKTSDSIPFFVRPSKKAWKQREGKVALVISTFTYLAYANEHLWEKTRLSAIDVGPNFDPTNIAQSEHFERLKRRSDLGLSNYDVHNDESGVVYSSAKRPILNIRPNYIMWAFKRPREFSADTMLIGLLEREQVPYEIITDHDLHERGVAAISGFNTVITGAHPEYPSVESYNAYTAYATQGGNLMYLGGNGFYWVTATDMAMRPHRLEVRRGDQGVRSYGLPGGEHVLSTNGQLGTLWRTRGRACNVLFGIGFSGEGAGPGVPYKRTDLSKTDKSVSWMFEGFADGEDLIGEFGLGGGASGDEMDRFDEAIGSPSCVKILASSTGHPDDFCIVPEDLVFPPVHTLGTQTDLIRSDLTYYVNSGGGGIFSVGSINWMCSLGWDDYQNNVAKLTANVIKGFLGGLR
ncbi:uncharacterized protein Z518_07271 [Rhinocladiella mackenziei CBS 650.93]|uniref:N,N-dimethylformamidase beta subunit-like C-terminal domain-containing protein n=1 Tax=Rhinocladiella mackenziei CBS 650.93 TaxID=1442369 RepID=A0A0D2GZU0_9EURO|nr:uncharacterized protein Z518_07271 [Rhinocladiella mackenziei CBS 650.93]KIX03718.1 hypothetical protein Z518_07271 [Rhinocladiella mackenziei CBS 650.93]